MGDGEGGGFIINLLRGGDFNVYLFVIKLIRENRVWVSKGCRKFHILNVSSSIPISKNDSFLISCLLPIHIKLLY